MKNQGEWRFWVYIIASRSRVIYVGMTGNLEQRVWDHKTEAIEGFTQKYKCHRLVHFECFDDVRNAIAREKEIKAWRREKKIRLIEGTNPTWEDLAGERFADLQQRIEKSRSLTAEAVRDDTHSRSFTAKAVRDDTRSRSLTAEAVRDDTHSRSLTAEAVRDDTDKEFAVPGVKQ